jgi:hypothetical protein
MPFDINFPFLSTINKKAITEKKSFHQTDASILSCHFSADVVAICLYSFAFFLSSSSLSFLLLFIFFFSTKKENIENSSRFVCWQGLLAAQLGPGC